MNAESIGSGLLHETGFQRHRAAIDLAGDLVITGLQADVFGLGPLFQHLGAAAQFEILDQGDRVSVGEGIAVSVFDHALGFRRSFSGPFMAAGRAFPVMGMTEHVVECTRRAGWIGHVEKKKLRAERETTVRSDFVQDRDQPNAPLPH